MEEASRRERTPLFKKNDNVGYVYRRLVNNSIAILEELKRETQAFAAQLGDDQNWVALWQVNLPLVELYNVRVQQQMADEFLRTQRADFNAALEKTYETYVSCNFGKTADGRINRVSFSSPPLYEFYHAFLTQLMQEPHVMHTSVFDNMVKKIYDVVERAFLDALRVVFHGRVKVLETRTKEEVRALRQAAAAPAARAPAASSSTSSSLTESSVSEDVASAASAASSMSMVRAWKDGMRSTKQQRHGAFTVVPTKDMTKPSDSVTQISSAPPSARSDIRVLPVRAKPVSAPTPAPVIQSELTRSTTATRSVVY